MGFCRVITAPGFRYRFHASPLRSQIDFRFPDLGRVDWYWPGICAMLLPKGIRRPSKSWSFFRPLIARSNCSSQLHRLSRSGRFVYQRDGMMAPVGRVTRVKDPDSTEKSWVYADRVFAELYATAPQIGPEDYLTFHETPESFGWVAEMMLPPKTREKIGELILKAFQEHQQEIVTAFRPIIENSIRESVEIIRADLQRALEARESELARLGDKFRSDLVEKELTPLVQNEIWPIVQRQSQPLVNEIGQEIWKEVSIWRFTWKYLYDRTPLPQRNLADKEFRRFVDSKVVPILESHLGDFVSLQRKILNQIAGNQAVKETFSRSVREIMGDAEVQQLVVEIFEKSFLIIHGWNRCWKKIGIVPQRNRLWRSPMRGWIQRLHQLVKSCSARRMNRLRLSLPACCDSEFSIRITSGLLTTLARSLALKQNRRLSVGRGS